QFSFQTVYAFFSLITWHPIVILILIFKPGPLSKDIRIGYIINQACLMLNEWFFSLLFKITILMPYPALHCGGPLCTLGMNQQVVTFIMAWFVTIPVPPFVFLLLSMHQKMVLNTASRFRYTKRTQFGMMAALITIMSLNAVGFGVFGVRATNSAEIMRRPELSWLVDRQGVLLLFGDVGDAGMFKYECYFLLVTISIVFPVVAFFSVHATYTIQLSKGITTNRTVLLVNRTMSVILIQLTSIFISYNIPISLLGMTIIFDMPESALGVMRPLLTVSQHVN
ncbi:hypothetical protein PFISCL1PPCAC_14245, partial [Pristionchus fissidentatus]